MLAEMAAQMQQLRVEKEELQGRNNQLEGLLKVQQQQQHDRSGSRRLHATQVGWPCNAACVQLQETRDYTFRR